MAKVQLEKAIKTSYKHFFTRVFGRAMACMKSALYSSFWEKMWGCRPRGKFALVLVSAMEISLTNSPKSKVIWESCKTYACTTPHHHHNSLNLCQSHPISPNAQRRDKSLGSSPPWGHGKLSVFGVRQESLIREPRPRDIWRQRGAVQLKV